ncbi:MAG: Rrf2 family transcriptional regulator [Crocinitomicaceae bacterium]|nr:Rrf2 family transcriptional regulator [Crocinitomicaceae bacterium]
MLSKKSKYGLKALTYIASQNNEELVQISEISESEKISRKFLEAILLTLKKAGFLSSKKGKRGGYYLLKAADEIIMSDVIRVLEGPIAMVPCVSLNFYEHCDDCIDENKCSVQMLMLEVRDSMLDVLSNKSLADMVNDLKACKKS